MKPTQLSRSLRLAVAVTTLLSAACGAEPKRRATEVGSDARADATVPVPGAPRDAAYSEPPLPDGSNGEVCDSLDNNGDGIVDNVDIAGDGICDCLNVATVGDGVYAGRSVTFEAWLDQRSSTVTALGSGVISAELIAGLDVIIVLDVKQRAYSADEVAALSAWVQNGGGLFTLTAYTDEGSTNVNMLLAPYGLSYGDGLVAFSPLGSIAATPLEHPIMESVSAVGVAGAYQVLGAGEPIATVPVTLIGGSPVVVGRALSVGKGKVIAWGDEWITYNSDWVDRSEFDVERLWQNTLQWLVPVKYCKVEIPLR